VSIQATLSERRLVLRLLDYWREARKERHWPAPDDFYPAAIPDLWEFCFVLDLAGPADNAEPVFSYIGTYHKQMYDLDLAGVALTDADQNTLIGRAASYAGDVVSRSVPVTYGGQFIDSRGYNVLYRSIMLPLSRDNQAITAILGAASCREKPPEMGEPE
jgi:hypothetical protein